MGTPNKVSNMTGSYVQSVGFAPGVIADEAALLAKGSTELLGVCVDNSGIIYVSDPVRHAIFKITEKGDVYLYAGLPGTSGNNAGVNKRLLAARFNTPRGITVDLQGNLYVADTGNNQIQKITPDGWVTLLAGAPNGSSGSTDGLAASFNAPWGITIDASNNIYIADTGNNRIRKMRSGLQKVMTIAGSTSGDVLGQGTAAKFKAPRAVVLDAAGVCYIGDTGNNKVKKLDVDGNVTLVASGFDDIFSIATDRSRNLFVVDFAEATGSKLTKVTYNGVKNVIATSGHTLICGAYVDRSGKIKIVESLQELEFYSSESSVEFSTSSDSSDSSESSDSSASSQP